ncbi:siderophore ABC transporter substrate-binding protein [Defluviitalea phaphyphila]|uniref:siderophore ABC transporter substrate-binding protein n=1 Tax=Defluviitalea phaphyphila TaxID=1473580 RepID=UPI0007301ACA|nr:siderophore ABC transporter substrate-binding protein [Defluviitalea phaphyphila]
MKKLTILLSIIVIFALGVMGCSSNTTESVESIEVETTENIESKDDTSAIETKSESEPETITINHKLGEVVVNKNPKNIVVFDYATIDVLDELGIEVKGLPKSNIPAYLEKFNDDKYVDVGTLFEPNFEKIFELEPEVIFISARQAKLYEEFSKIAPTVYLELSGADYIDIITDNFNILGEIFDREDFIEQELAKIKEDIEDINNKVKEEDKNAIVLLANDGSMSAFGEDSRFGMIYTEFGFKQVAENIETSTHGQNISFEYILEQNPDYIFIVDKTAISGGSISTKEMFDNEIVKKTKAYKNDNIIYVDPEVWYVSPGGLKGTKIMLDEIKAAIEK